MRAMAIMAFVVVLAFQVVFSFLGILCTPCGFEFFGFVLLAVIAFYIHASFFKGVLHARVLMTAAALALLSSWSMMVRSLNAQIKLPFPWFDSPIWVVVYFVLHFAISLCGVALLQRGLKKRPATLKPGV